LHASLGPAAPFFGSLPGVVPVYSWQMFLTPFAHVPEMVAVSPKLLLMPASSDLPLVAMTFLIMTLRRTEFLQLPQERYSLPKLSALKPSMVTVPAPLCWMILSSAPWAPPPMTLALPSPLMESASMNQISFLSNL
jgi:hypothetical protein